MPIYRVTFHTEVLVEANNEREAQRIGYHNLKEEVENGHSSLYTIDHITSVDQLRREERDCLPWRAMERNWKGEPERYIEEILGEQQQ